MHNFTPISAFIGGVLIGVSTILLMWFNGRIAGVSGILHGLFPPHKNDFLWRLLFLVGLATGSFIYYLIPEIQFQPRNNYPIWLLISAGFLVGVGTRMSGGCTSGHGVCGLARLSARSFIAVILFFISAMVTVYIVKHIGNIS